jgi:hypothetical protein
MTTEDEVMRLLRRADPDRGPVHAPSVDGTDYLAALHTRSTTVTLTDTESTPPGPKHRHLWPIVAVAAAAVVAVGVGGLVLATRDDDQTGDVPANQPTTVPLPTTVAEQSPQPAQPPVEFTACSHAGPEEKPLTVEQISLPDGETTIERESLTYRQTATDVSDPRLEGTWYHTEDNDNYHGPGTDGLTIGTWTRRIENHDGAWQGTTHQTIDYPDGVGNVGGAAGPYIMIGEGAYEGLTAILTQSDGSACPNERGYIFEGTIPSPTVQTGD